MSKVALSSRANWEKESGIKAAGAEKNLYDVFNLYFEGTIYKLHKKPKHLKNLYATVHLDENTINQIYNPPINYQKRKWGVTPDFAIENTKTGKILFGEIKRQDGWVENKKPSAGRGNAHERLCKMFAPGLLKKYREISGIIDEDILPFWVVFEGDITRDPKRVREITLWFDQFYMNFFMWRSNMSANDLIHHFETYLKKYLD